MQEGETETELGRMEGLIRMGNDDGMETTGRRNDGNTARYYTFDPGQP